jgi:hypothetical protein
MVGPRYTTASCWKGNYVEKELKYFIPLYTRESDKTRASGIIEVVCIIPNTWISEDFPRKE